MSDIVISHSIRMSDHRLSSTMKELLEKMMLGQTTIESEDFQAATAQALSKRNLLTPYFEMTELGRRVASELISRKPKQFAQPRLRRLIHGLAIFEKYAPNALVFTSKNDKIDLQEEAFEDLSREDILTLDDLGWTRTAPLSWSF